MTPLLPAVLAGAAAAVAVGLPTPSRLLLLAPRTEPYSSTSSAALLVRLGRLGGRRRVLGMMLLALGGVPTFGPEVLLVPLALLGAERVARVRRARAAREQERQRAGEACAVLAGEACAVLAGELRAGRSAAQALTASADVATGAVRLALLAASSSAGLGGDVPAALLGKASASAAPELLAGLGACWQVCAGTGSGLAMAVDRLEEGLRAEQGQRLAVAAELAGPRATAGLLACLPLAGIALAAGLGARPVHVLLHTTIGLACAVLGVGLDGLGVWWTGRLVARVGGAT